MKATETAVNCGTQKTAARLCLKKKECKEIIGITEISQHHWQSHLVSTEWTKIEALCKYMYSYNQSVLIWIWYTDDANTDDWGDMHVLFREMKVKW